jgi:hypothetical protein
MRVTRKSNLETIATGRSMPAFDNVSASTRTTDNENRNTAPRISVNPHSSSFPWLTVKYPAVQLFPLWDHVKDDSPANQTT